MEEYELLINDEVGRSPGFIYFIVSVDGYVKIVYSKDIHIRLGDLQVGNPHHLSLEYFEEGSRKDEQDYHNKFYSYRKRGEWFRHSGGLKNWLRHKRNKQQQRFNEEELKYG